MKKLFSLFVLMTFFTLNLYSQVDTVCVSAVGEQYLGNTNRWFDI